MSISTTPEFMQLVMAIDHDIPADTASDLLAAFYEAVRTEVRVEVAADVHRAGLPSFLANERPDLVAKTVRAVDVRIAEQGAEAPYGVAEQPSLAGEQPNFYESGRTYLGDYGWKFRVDIITTHPEDGERTALGWRLFNDAWEPYAYGEGDWEILLLSGLEIAPEGGERS